MDKIWLQHYPAHVPADIDADAYTSIGDLFHQSIQRYGSQIAYSNLGKTMSYQELEQLSRQFAAFLVQFGLKKGDRIALMMPNLLQYPVALFGAFRAGLIVVNTNPLYTQRELEHQLNDSGAKAIIILENFAHTLDKVIGSTGVKIVITTQLGDLLGFPKSLIVNFMVKYIKKMVPAFNLPQAISFKKALSLGKEQHDFHDIPLTLSDVAFLQYTGGTTGVAKGAALTHRNMVANLLQAEAWTISILEEGKEIFITALPLYHVFALTANALFALKIGAKNILITNPRDIPAFVKTLKAEPFSYLTGVNTLFNALLNNKDFATVDFSHLKITLGGGMAVQKAVATRWQETTACTLLEAYGLTETSPAVCINPTDLEQYNGMIGLPISSTEVSIRDTDGQEVALNTSGELWVRGPQVMQGYWQRAEETEKVLDEEGWLRTGDVAQINEQGYVKIVDRLKDMILVSGFNVYPNEVEDVVAIHEKVLEVGAVGIPHEKSGEVVKIFVVKKDDSLTEDELKAHCKAKLAAYKCPKAIRFVDSLPKSNVGKILRRALRELN